MEREEQKISVNRRKEQGKMSKERSQQVGGAPVEHEEQKISVNSHFVEFLARQPGNVA